MDEPTSDPRAAVIAELARKPRTQSELVAATGLTQARLSEWLAGKRDMTGENIAKVLGALGLGIRPVRPPRGRG